MRDIRDDLRERLTALRKEREELESKLESVRDLEQSVQVLVDAEHRRWDAVSRTEQFMVISRRDPDYEGTPLGAVLNDLLGDGRPHSTGELAEFAAQRGYPFGEKRPKRVIHFAMLGMSSNGTVNRLSDGTWQKPLTFRDVECEIESAA